MKSTFEKMGGTYTLGADGIYYPNLVSTDEEPHYGKYGMMRKTYLKEHRPAMYSLYMLEDRLTEHLNVVDDEAQERMDILVRQMMEKQGITEELKVRDQMEWVRPFMNRFIDKEEYPDDMFIKKEEAENYLTASTVVIVVDVNRPQRTECPQLLDKCKTIIVFDHHRRSSDTITGAVLSYVDPYASSACEMVTEMIQYVDDGIKLKAFEADALYAGISIDTDGFNSKSGPRTFEAAAFLRRHGADVTRVRKMLRNDMNEYKAIASAVSKSEVYKSAFAITVFDGEGLESPTIGGAKAANQLLDISGIKASFVITQYEDKLYISARSIDEVNVQLVMEKLGGGGHMSIAGAQLTNCTIQQAVNTIKLTLDNMLAEGEI